MPYSLLLLALLLAGCGQKGPLYLPAKAPVAPAPAPASAPTPESQQEKDQSASPPSAHP